MSSATTLQPFVEAFLEERHRLGFDYRSMGYALRSFAAYVDGLQMTGPLRIEVMARWARCPKNASDDPLTWARRLKLLRPFARWFRQFEPDTEVPDNAIFRGVAKRLAPHIYTEQEISDLLATAHRLQPPLLEEAESLTQRYAESGLSSRQFAEALSVGIGASNKSDRGAVTEAIKGVLRGGGTLTGTDATNEQLQDQIADDIARRVSSDRDFSARLAEGVKADTQSGTRNVFAERLTQEERSTLQEQASDTLSAARSLERSETMAERFGTLRSYRAVEIDHAVAGDPALMDRMYDRLGLTGDQQRLASSWSYLDVFADRDQANAAAGMALLLGYGEGDRELSQREQQTARRHADLNGRAPDYGKAVGEAHAVNLRDPPAPTGGLPGDLADHRRVTSDRYDPAEVNRSHDRYRGDVSAFLDGARSDTRE
jgi:conjugal transfer mating pair stabilization protein TraG